MNTYHLKYFVDAVRLGGVAASAEHNRLTHSAVSQSIRALENELGISLLDHEKRKFRVTEQGMVLFEQGRIWLQSLENMKNQVKDTEGKISGRLTIACPQSIAREILWKYLIKFRKKYPEVWLKIILGSADFVKNNVRSGNCDLGFLLDDENFVDLKSLTLDRGDYLVVSKTTGQKVGDQPLIVTSNARMEVQQICRGIKRVTKRNPDVVLEVQSWSLIRQFVKESDVFGVVPEFMVKSDIERGSLHEVKLNFEKPDYEIKSIWNSVAEINPKVIAFLKMIQ